MTSVFERPRLARVAPFIVLLTLCLVAEPANAQLSAEEEQEQLDAHTRTAARTLASQGAEAFERGDYDEALDLFQRAGSLIEAPTISLMEARSLVALGRLVEAANKYSITQLMNDPTQHNEAYQSAIVAAGQELELLKPRIPLAKVQLVGDLAAGEVEVWLDGRKLPEALVGVDNPLDPGRHRVEVRPNDGAPRAREFEIAEGERETLRFGTKVPASAPTPTPPPPPPPVARPEPVVMEESPAATPSQPDTFPWIVLGAGGLATVFGIGTGIAALSKKSDLDDAGCNTGCPPEYRGDITAFRRYRTFSYVGFGLGLAGLGWGGYLLVNQKPDEPSVGLWVRPTGAGVHGTF